MIETHTLIETIVLERAPTTYLLEFLLLVAVSHRVVEHQIYVYVVVALVLEVRHPTTVEHPARVENPFFRIGDHAHTEVLQVLQNYRILEFVHNA